MKTRIHFILLGMFLLTTSASAKLRLPALIGDHMVLQQGQPAVIWGWAEKGQTITVEMADKKASAVAGDKGAWKVSLPAFKAGGPHTMTITDGEASTTLRDILVGEVWLGSGQSNMEFMMSHTRDAKVQIPKAKFPKIHIFTVQRSSAPSPLDDVTGSWQVCSPKTVAGFSAVAYHFGKGIHQALKTPVGLIASDWGGSPVEDWIPSGTLEQIGAPSSLGRAARDPMVSQKWFDGTKFDLWISDIKLIPKDKKKKEAVIAVEPSSDKKGLGGNWTANANPASKVSFEAGRFSGRVSGGGFGTCTTTLSSNGKPVDLRGYEAIEFTLKGNGARFKMLMGQSSIADGDFYGTDFFDIHSDEQVIRVPLDKVKQAGWGIKKPFTPGKVLSLQFVVDVPYWPEVISSAYNGMIAPMTNYPIRGVLWYQGESNTGRPGEYHQLLSAMIGGWREKWGQKDMPFLIVQLPNYLSHQPQPSESGWAELREAQLQTLDVPHTGMTTNIDLGEADNIHPLNKNDVGKRLAICALSTVYDKGGVATGPLFESLSWKGDKVTLHFQQVGKGLKVKGKVLNGFAMAGKDRQFHWAKAKVVGKTVEVWCPDVKEPVEVRYAWADNPVCSLYNQAGLPASPFRAKVGGK